MGKVFHKHAILQLAAEIVNVGKTLYFGLILSCTWEKLLEILNYSMSAVMIFVTLLDITTVSKTKQTMIIVFGGQQPSSSQPFVHDPGRHGCTDGHRVHLQATHD